MISTLIMVEVLSQQLTSTQNLRGRTEPSPSSLRDRHVQTERTELSQVRRDLYHYTSSYILKIISYPVMLMFFILAVNEISALWGFSRVCVCVCSDGAVQRAVCERTRKNPNSGDRPGNFSQLTPGHAAHEQCLGNSPLHTPRHAHLRTHLYTPAHTPTRC